MFRALPRRRWFGSPLAGNPAARPIESGGWAAGLWRNLAPADFRPAVAFKNEPEIPMPENLTQRSDPAGALIDLAGGSGPAASPRGEAAPGAQQPRKNSLQARYFRRTSG